MQMECRPFFMRIGIDVIDAIGIESRRATDDAVYLVTFREQELGEIRSILSGNARDKRFRCSLIGSRSQEILLRGSQLLSNFGTPWIIRDEAAARTGVDSGVSLKPRIDRILPTPIGRS